MSNRRLASGAFLSVLLLSTVSPASPAAAQGHYLRQPTGNGQTVVFQFNDRLWRFDKGARAAVPLTGADTQASTPAISPDGQAVAYVAATGTDNEVYLVSLRSGQIRRLTYDGGFNVKVQGWLSNNEVLYSTTIKSKKRGPLLYAVHTDTLAARPLPLVEASEGCVLGNELIFVKNEELIDANRNYQGGYAQRLYKIDMALLTAEPAAADPKRAATVLLSRDYEGISRNPVCVGKRIYFLSDRTGRYNVWSMNAEGRDLAQHTFEKEHDIKSVAASTANQLFYQKLGEIFRLDLRRGASQKIAIAVPPDAAQRQQRRKLDVAEATDYRVSSDGSTVIMIAHGKLWAVDVANRSARCIVCDSGVRVKSPEVTSDGKAVIALADASGEYDLYRYSLGADAAAVRISHDIREPLFDLSLSPDDASLLVLTLSGKMYHVDVRGSGAQRVDLTTRTRPQDISWSHDGRYAAFVTYTSQDIGQITVFDKRCSSIRYLTSGRYEVSSPVFSADDSEIFYITQANYRSGVIDTWAPGNYWPAYDNKSLIQVVRFGKRDADCAEQTPRPQLSRESRLLSREVPIVAGNYDRLLLHGGRLHAFSKREARDDWGYLVAVPEDRSGSRLLSQPLVRDGVFDYRLSTNGQSLVASGPDGLLVVRSGAPRAEPILLNSISGLEVTIDLAREREQMFGEVWRLYRDYFWDADMGGVDWKAARAKYAGFLPRVSNRTEFNELVSYMVAELSAGHTVIGAPVTRAQNGGSVGKLGGTFAEDDGLRVVEIYDGDVDVMEERSPLSLTTPPVEAGDRITRVNGLPVVDRSSLNRLLEGKVGQTVIVTVRKPDGRSRDVRVAPISAEHEAWLRSHYWASSNQQYVDRVSDSKVGYIRLSASYEPDFAGLVRQYAYFHRRPALILDLRGNNGGNIDPWLLHFFQRRTWLYVRDRYDTMALRHPRESFEGQLVVLIDGDTYSDGELIAEGVRRLGLGILVGTRTAGAGVWVNDDNALIDGGSVRIPVSGSYVTENGRQEWVIEGRGVTPDVVVENDPYAAYFGHDAQLQAAVEVALKAMKTTPLQTIAGGGAAAAEEVSKPR